MGDESELRVEEACDAAGEGDYARLDATLERLWAAGTSRGSGAARGDDAFPAAAFWRRRRWKKAASADAAMRRLRPPVHFSREASFKAQARALDRADGWPRRSTMLYEAEALAKTTAVPAEATAGRALLAVAAIPRARR